MRNKRMKSARKRLAWFKRDVKARHYPSLNDDFKRFQTGIKRDLNPVPTSSIWVENWRSGWKWFSSWAFAMIIFFGTMPVPEEILSIMPEDKKNYFLAFLAFWGLVCRFINQEPVNQTQEKDDG